MKNTKKSKKINRNKSKSRKFKINQRKKQLKKIEKKNPLNQRYIKMGGNIDNFNLRFESKDNNVVEIGRGGYGIVYLDKQQSESVFKVSKRQNTCREWNNESKIYEKIQTNNIDTSLCKIIKMKNSLFNDELCIIELTRAYNPLGIDKYYTIHPQFQLTDFNYKYHGRGLFLGINELIENNIFTNENIKNYIRDLGIIMARLHYKIKNDGYDIELFISKNNEEDTIIYIGDFDLSQFYETPNIERLSWCFLAMTYFPIEGELYEIFSKNYIDEANKYQMGEIAEKVLVEYKLY
jgi:hypothetical protein